MKHILMFILMLCPLVIPAQNTTVTRPQKQQTEKPKQSNPQKQTPVASNPNANNTQSLANDPSSYTPMVKSFTANGVSFQMVEVRGGTFTMGATSEQGNDAYDDVKLAHQVTLSSYYIGKYEVTQDLWQAVMGNNPSNFKGNRKPVDTISWNDCQTFISKLNSLTGKSFRLPTEAEWEFACRGGIKSKGYKYSGSNTLDNVAWYGNNSDSTTHEIGTKVPNELGLYDMSGNVLEWCSDWYGLYSSSLQTNPRGASSGSYRVSRGGSWSISAWGCRVSDRDRFSPGFFCYELGLRLALSE